MFGFRVSVLIAIEAVLFESPSLRFMARTHAAENGPTPGTAWSQVNQKWPAISVVSPGQGGGMHLVLGVFVNGSKKRVAPAARGAWRGIMSRK